MIAATFTRGDRVRVASRPGIAFYVEGPAQRWEPARWWCEPGPDDDPDDWPTDAESGERGYWVDDETEGEWVDDPDGGLVVVMVGDDREWTLEAVELSPLDEGDYCGGCGQIGCGW